MKKSKTFRNLFAIIKWECYNKQTCRVEIDSAVILVLRNNLIKAKQYNQHDEISQLTLKLNQIYENKLNGAQIRSRLPPLSSIDDPSPLAPIIENLTQSKSLLPTDSNTPPPNISTEKLNSINFHSFLSFFKNLWKLSSSLLNPSTYLDTLNFLISHEVLQTLPSSPLITCNEIRSAIQTLNPNSAPGLDGFTPKLYSSFPSLIPILCQTFNNVYLQKKLAHSQSLSLIKLIPKIPNPISVKDWRPISLLNTDYKILSSIISSRLKPLLNSIISLEQ